MNEGNVTLLEKLSRLQWLLHKHHLRTHSESGPVSDPTRGQGRIFAILRMKDGISTKELSYLLGIRISSLNELLSKMVRNGYITREPSEEDKRVMLIRLTEKGRDERQPEWSPDTIFACLTEDEQAAFSDYLDRIIAALEMELGEGTDEEERDWWKNCGRERMGEEVFDRLAAMRHGRHHDWEAVPLHHPELPHHRKPLHHPEPSHHGDEPDSMLPPDQPEPSGYPEAAGEQEDK